MNQNENVTPHNVEAECSVLGALMIDNNAVDRLGDLRIEHFFRSEHRPIFAEIRQQIASGKGCDVLSVAAALEKTMSDAMPYLNSIAQNTPSSANIGRYAEIVRDKALLRGLIIETSRLADLAFNPKGKTAGEVLDVAQGAISALAETRVMREPVRASEAMVGHVDVLDARVEGKVSGIATGLSGIDALLNGGPNRGNLVILGARPSMGKTALALNIAANVARDYGVLFLSQEMGTGELLDRLIAFLGRVSLSAVLTGKLDNQDWNGFTAGIAKLKELNLHLDEQPALTLLDVRSKARLIKRRHGLDLLVIDYLQLMSGEGQNRNSQLEEITRGLKALAKELNIVVLALSQLSRNAANMQRPKMSDLRDSGAIEQDADIVMFAHRDEVDNPGTHLRGICDIFIGKNRQGRIDDVMLTYEGMYTAFSDFHGQRPAGEKKEYKRGLAKDL